MLNMDEHEYEVLNVLFLNGSSSNIVNASWDHRNILWKEMAREISVRTTEDDQTTATHYLINCQSLIGHVYCLGYSLSWNGVYSTV